MYWSDPIIHSVWTFFVYCFHLSNKRAYLLSMQGRNIQAEIFLTKIQNRIDEKKSGKENVLPDFSKLLDGSGFYHLFQRSLIYLQIKYAKRSNEQAMKTIFFLSFLYICQIRANSVKAIETGMILSIMGMKKNFYVFFIS